LGRLPPVHGQSGFMPTVITCALPAIRRKSAASFG
jgi:hypothetical protein